MFVSPRELEAVPLEEALERWYNELEFRDLGAPKPAEELDVVDSVGRVTAEAVVARRSSPHYYMAAVDGLAVKSTHTFGATPEKPVAIKLGADGNFVDTGSPLPGGTDTVVPLHEVQFINAEQVGVSNPSVPWRNVSPVGEDVHTSEVIVPRHNRIRAVHLGAMLRGGVGRVAVRQRPRIGMIPLGRNLVAPQSEPGVGQRVEALTPILSNLCREAGADAEVCDFVRERVEDLDAAIRPRLADWDLLVVVSGRSHGTAVPASWIAERGALVVYGANIKPGQSVTLGVVDNVPVVALPGNAVSAYITFDLFVRPLIGRLLGALEDGQIELSAVLGQQIVSPAGTDEYLRVYLADVGGRRIAVPISRGADIVTSLVRASGILHVPAEVEAIPDGNRVEVRLIEPTARFDHNLLIMGTYDVAFDLLRNAMARHFPEVTLQTANVGSRQGLVAIRKGYCHAAGLHLFDPETGTYNETFVRQHMAEVPLVLINFFRRQMGFIVKKGNPKNIAGLADLLRADVTFVNRQHGSGTRVLIDYHFRKAGLDPALAGRQATETYTHMSTAATVASGAADVGIGIATVARALDLDFIPFIVEHLDLAIPRRYLQSFQVQSMLRILHSREFRSEVEALMHYDTELTGRVVYEGEFA
jgi:putative molybdopterin biosynthesis protein